MFAYTLDGPSDGLIWAVELFYVCVWILQKHQQGDAQYQNTIYAHNDTRYHLNSLSYIPDKLKLKSSS